MSRGYIELPREVFAGNPFWEENRSRTRWEALVDLYQHARWKDGHQTVKGKTISLSRGSFVASERYLSDRWCWSRNKVRRFLSELQVLGQISRKKDRGETVLTLDRYWDRDVFETVSDTTEGTAERTRHETTNDTGERTGKGPPAIPHTGPQKDQIEEGNKEDQENKEKKETDVFLQSPAQELQSKLISINPDWAMTFRNQFGRWGHELAQAAEAGTFEEFPWEIVEKWFRDPEDAKFKSANLEKWFDDPGAIATRAKNWAKSKGKFVDQPSKPKPPPEWCIENPDWQDWCADHFGHESLREVKSWWDLQDFTEQEMLRRALIDRKHIDQQKEEAAA